MLFLVFTLFCAGLFAATMANLGTVYYKNGAVQVQKEGVLTPLEQELDLSATIKVQTNGTFTVQGGKPRNFKEGQVLRKDGYLLSADGTIVPVFDRIVMEKGNVVMVYKDGEAAPLTRDVTLPNKLSITPKGTMTLPNGELSRLIEGQMVQPDGTFLPSRDTVTLKNGQVFVQKEGAQFQVAPGRTIMMNDGTKVFGSGKMVSRDGTTTPLKENEVVILQGVVKDGR